MSGSHLREIPPVGAILEHPRVHAATGGRHPRWLTRLARDVVEARRRELGEAGEAPSRQALLDELAAALVAERDRLLGPSLRRVLNGTGVVVHTNLGRSLYPETAVAAVADAARHFVDLELDLASGRRGHRGRLVERKLALLGGAEDALVVNNNAAAVWLAVRAVAGAGGRVVLSRGEAVAIGGSFRLPEILAETGCELHEVGTTNRTAPADYERALTPGAVVLKVHRSNFAVSGFTEEVPPAELAALCRRAGATLIHDAGSGALFPFSELGLRGETTLEQDLAAGADLVTCSGDKLLGGVQAGFLLGRADLVGRMREHPMRRTFRVDKSTLAATDAVLTIYLQGSETTDLPTLAFLARPVASLQERAQELAAALRGAAPAGWSVEVVPGEGSVGGGSFSEERVPTRLLLWRGPKAELEACHARLRRQDPALLTRMNQEGLAVDVRCLRPEELPLVVSAFRAAWGRDARGA